LFAACTYKHTTTQQQHGLGGSSQPSHSFSFTPAVKQEPGAAAPAPYAAVSGTAAASASAAAPAAATSAAKTAAELRSERGAAALADAKKFAVAAKQAAVNERVRQLNEANDSRFHF
jgi:hypothetical protein